MRASAHKTHSSFPHYTALDSLPTITGTLPTAICDQSTTRGAARQSAIDNESKLRIAKRPEIKTYGSRHSARLVLIVQALDPISDCVAMPVIYGR
jgi:hypothetical protein